MVVTIIHHTILNRFYIADLLLENNLLGGSEYAHSRGYASMVSTWRHVQKTFPVPPARKQPNVDAVGWSTGTVALLPVVPVYVGIWSKCECWYQLSGWMVPDPGKRSHCRLGECSAWVMAWRGLWAGMLQVVRWVTGSATKILCLGAISNGIGSAAGYGIGKGIT